MKDIFIVKTGDSIPSLVARRGDFEDWIIAGIEDSHSFSGSIVPAHKGGLLPDLGLIGGIIITGSHSMVTDDFLTSDRNGAKSEHWKQIAEKKIRESDGVMIMLSEHTAADSGAAWEIDCALSNNVPVAGVDIRKDPDGNIPEKLVGKMTRFGLEWFAVFIDGL